MARTQSFEREAVVRAAREVFWDLGFEGASVPALEDATGLRRSSIYNTFGSKRGLFDEAVQSYLDEVIRPRLAPLRAPEVAPEAVLVYLDSLREALAREGSRPARSGCLLINAAGSPIGHDAAVAATIAAYRAELREAIGRGIRARGGAEDGAADRDRLADAVTGLVVAAFALVRIAPDEASRALVTARELILAAAP